MARQRRLAPASTIIHRYGVNDILLHNVEYQHQGKRVSCCTELEYVAHFFLLFHLFGVHGVPFMKKERKENQIDEHTELFCNAARLIHIFHSRNILAKGVLFL